MLHTWAVNGRKFVRFYTNFHERRETVRVSGAFCDLGVLFCFKLVEPFPVTANLLFWYPSNFPIFINISLTCSLVTKNDVSIFAIVINI